MATNTATQNGVNVEQLVATINAVKENPELGRFKFRANSEWLGGARSRTQIQGFYGAGKEDDTRTRPYVIEGDEPPVLLGANAAPNAVEAVLHALASCLAVGFIYNASAQGIRVEALSFDLEGELDLRNFLGISDQERAGYQNLRIKYRVKADAPKEKLLELCNYVQRTSPVLDIVRNPVPVSMEMVA
jgi:uncharacterized OsmC-like protein